MNGVEIGFLMATRPDVVSQMSKEATGLEGLSPESVAGAGQSAVSRIAGKVGGGIADAGRAVGKGFQGAFAHPMETAGNIGAAAKSLSPGARTALAILGTLGTAGAVAGGSMLGGGGKEKK